MLKSLLKIYKNKDQILEGIKNRIFKKEHVEEIYEERILICKGCESYDESGSGCAVPGTSPCCNQNKGGCGCSLALKCRALASECPKKKWGPVLSEFENAMLQIQLHEDDKSEGNDN